MLLQDPIGTNPRAHSLVETSVLTGMGQEALRAAIRDGRLVARRLGRRVIVTDADLRRFLEALPRIGEDRVA
jgi:hypothetical protein